jgi:hypothetical protein
MPNAIYDGNRMRARYPGEKSPYSPAGVVLKFFFGFLVLLGAVLCSMFQRSGCPRSEARRQLVNSR